MPTVSSPHTQRSTTRRTLRCVVVGGVVLVVLVLDCLPVLASTTVAAPATLQDVVTNLRNWLVTLLVALATLFLTIGGVRYLAADGDPGEVERAKKTLRNAMLGYALAMLAPLIVTALRSLVG